jgi:hypothetical protein
MSRAWRSAGECASACRTGAGNGAKAARCRGGIFVKGVAFKGLPWESISLTKPLDGPRMLLVALSRMRGS